MLQQPAALVAQRVWRCSEGGAAHRCRLRGPVLDDGGCAAAGGRVADKTLQGDGTQWQCDISTHK